MKKLYLLLLFTPLLFALSYEDDDIDGVPNAQDLCPFTPFDITVNRYGCDMKKLFMGEITFKLSQEILLNQESPQENQLTLALSYQLASWQLSLANSNHQLNDFTEEDLYLFLSYFMQTPHTLQSFSFGTKFAFIDEAHTTRENDYIFTYTNQYTLSTSNHLIFTLEYTHSGEMQSRYYTIEYEDIKHYDVTLLHQWTPRYTNSISLSFDTPLYQNESNYYTLAFSQGYLLHKKYLLETAYRYTKNQTDRYHIMALSIGVTFE